MPFTPAHIAAVLPLRKRWNLIWSALIVGSVAPDFEYFLTLGPQTHRFHVFPGVLYYTLPIAFFVLWIVHRFLKGPVLDLLPVGIAERMDPAPLRFRGLLQLGLIFLSLSLGIATHIAWDSFTHESTLVTDHLAVEHAQVPLPVVGPKKMYKVLQFGSSAVGLAILAAYFFFWYKRTQPRRKLTPAHSIVAKLVFWFITSTAALLFGVHHAHVKLGSEALGTREGVVIAVVTAMTVFFWEVLAFSVFVQARRQWMIRERNDASARSTL